MQEKRIWAAVTSLIVLLGVAVAQVKADDKPVIFAPEARPELIWLGHAAFLLKTPGGASIAIDPWIKNPKAPAKLALPQELDAILITHGHFDHVGDTLFLAKKTKTQVIGSFELIELLKVKNGVGVNPGGTIQIKDVTIHVVEAVHSSGYTRGVTDKKLPRYAGAPVGYVIDIKGGPTVYHAGDTDVFASMSLIGERYHPTYALLPIGGHFTMNPTGAALAAKLLGVSIVVPMHYGTFPMLSGTPDELKRSLRNVGTRIQVLAPNPGEPLRL